MGTWSGRVCSRRFPGAGVSFWTSFARIEAHLKHRLQQWLESREVVVIVRRLLLQLALLCITATGLLPNLHPHLLNRLDRVYLGQRQPRMLVQPPPVFLGHAVAVLDIEDDYAHFVEVAWGNESVSQFVQDGR